MQGWFRAFQNFQKEYDSELLNVDGTIPKELKGVLYRIGVGTYTAFGKRLPHWFDGDGAVIALQIENGSVTATSKMVRTRGTEIEEKAGRHLLGSYGIAPYTLSSRIKMEYRNAANTAVLFWNKRLFALWEGGVPTELSPRDLSTIGETSLEGSVVRAFSAHPHYVPKRKAYYNFGMRYVPLPKLDLFELQDSGKLSCLISIPCRGSTLAHDFMATSQYSIVMVPPVFVEPFSMFFRGKSLNESMHWKEAAGTEIYVIPMDRPKDYFKIRTSAFLPTHFFNGFEKDGKIYLDGIAYPDFTSVDRIQQFSQGIVAPMKPGAVFRYVIDPSNRTMQSSKTSSIPCETPQVSPLSVDQDYQWGYAISYSSENASHSQYFNALSKLNVKTGSSDIFIFNEEHYPSEPIFVPRPNGKSEDDGYLLTLVYDSLNHSSYLAILDALKFTSGPLAIARLPHAFPLTFHGTWV